MKLGIFGGTFSPPHKTHIEMAREAVVRLGLDELIVVPNGIPPHKPCKENKADRLEMSRLAFQSLPKTTVSTYELDKKGASYTYSTLSHFKEQYPQAEIFLIIGGDSLRDFGEWNNPGKIAELAALAVCRREGADYAADKNNAKKNFGARVEEIEINPNEVSSTKLRVDYQFEIDCSGRVAKPVDEYVLSKKLYNDFTPMVRKVKAMLSPERFEHTYYVVLAGQELKTQADKDKVFLACLLHDAAKEMTPADYARYGFKRGDLPEKVIHAPLGAKVAQTDFGVNDREILDAIVYHTTARPNMTELDMAVYVADKIEKTRPYPKRHLIAPTLGQTFVNCLAEIARKKNPGGHPLTQQAIDFYLK